MSLDFEVLMKRWMSLSLQVGFKKHFYDKLFEKSAEIKEMFENRNITVQSEMLVNAITTSISHTYQSEKDIEENWKHLAKVHSSIGVKREHFDIFEETFLEIMFEFADSKIPKEEEILWKKVMDKAIMEILKRYP